MNPSLRASAAAALVGVFLLSGCGDPPGCAEMCARQFECMQDFNVMPLPDQDRCTEDCETLSADDPDYAEAIEERAECFEDEACEAIVYNYACY